MPGKFTFFMLLNATPAWLSLTRAQRQEFVATHVRPLLARHAAVRLRFYDAEAFSGRCSDVAVWETENMQQYYFLIDALRDTAFFNVPYFTVIDIVPAIEDGYAEYDRAQDNAPTAEAGRDAA